MARENNYGVCIMTWKQAKQQIKNNVRVRMDVNTKTKKGAKRSKYREIKLVCKNGYIIPMGVGRYMFVTWDMLRRCWVAMKKNNGKYNIKAFKKHYSKHPGCYVQTIHMIFRKAGLT